MSFSAYEEIIWESIDFWYPSTRQTNLLQQIRSLFSPPRAENRNTLFSKTELKVQSRKCYALLSPNGTGKTTLLRLLARIIPGAKSSSPFKVLSFIDSVPPFITNLTVESNIKIFQTLQHFDDSPHAVEQILHKANLSNSRHKRIDQLSSGMISRLCLGILDFNVADLYLIDEVLSFGDQGAQEQLIKTIQSKKENGASVILACHNITLVSQLCDSGFEIQNGKIIPYPQIKQLISQYQERCLH